MPGSHDDFDMTLATAAELRRALAPVDPLYACCAENSDELVMQLEEVQGNCAPQNGSRPMHHPMDHRNARLHRSYSLAILLFYKYFLSIYLLLTA